MTALEGVLRAAEDLKAAAREAAKAPAPALEKLHEQTESAPRVRGSSAPRKRRQPAKSST